MEITVDVVEESLRIDVKIEGSGPPGPRGEGVPEYSETDNGKLLGVVNGRTEWVAGGSGSGNVSSPNVTTILVLDLSEYESITEKDSMTLYLIRG